jgi:acetoacetate decarboxylase
MVLTLEHVSETGPIVNDPPMYNTRHFPAAGGERPDVFELVRAGGRDREITEIWEGSADLRLYDDTLEDLQAIAPREMLRGYRFSFGYTVDGVEVVAQHQATEEARA